MARAFEPNPNLGKNKLDSLSPIVLQLTNVPNSDDACRIAVNYIFRLRLLPNKPLGLRAKAKITKAKPTISR